MALALGQPRVMGQSMWRAWSGLGLVCALAYFGISSTRSWAFTTLNMVTALAILLGANKWKPKNQTTWLLLGIGLAIYGWGKTIWFYADPSLHSTDPVNSVANIFLAVGYVLVVISLISMMRQRDPQNFRTSLLDAAIIVAGTAILWWVFLVQPVMGDISIPVSARLIGSLYPMMDVVMLAMFAGLLISPLRRTPSEKLVVAGIGAILFADGAYYYAALAMEYKIGSWADVGWLLGFVLLGAAAMHPSMTNDSVVVDGHHREITSRRLTFYVAAALVGPTTLGVSAVLGDAVSVTAFAVSSVGLYFLVLARVVGLLRDVETKVSQIDSKSQSLVAAEERYRTLVEQIPAVTYLHMANAHNSTIYISPRIEDLLGISVTAWSADPENWVKHLHPDDKARVLAENERKNRDGGSFEFEYRMIRPDGREVWVRDEGTLIRDASGEPAYWQGLLIDITERKELEDQLVHQAFHDPLTSLANRALFADRVEHALSHKGRHAATPLAVLFVDIDDFKTINDSLGHGAGDELLRLVAARLSESLRLSDTASRLGGDEFGVLVEDMEVPGDAVKVAQRIQEAIMVPYLLSGREVSIRASIGIAVSMDRESSADELLRNADLAMYMAKREGTGGYSIFEPRMHAAVVDRMQLKADLEKALVNGELLLNFQPIVELKTYRLAGVEALIRWKHPERGMVPPGDFIILAEETDLIERIGSWVLRAVCVQIKEWDAAGYGPLRVTVNLSGRQLESPELVHQVAGIFRETGVDAERIVFEITESAIMKDVQTSAEILGNLKQLGVSLAVDDFGTGYSSLSYLQSFPVDVLKIDQSFVRQLVEGPDKVALVRAVVKLGAELDLQTVAEGVEAREQSDILRELGCDKAQGFYFSPPRDANAITELLADEARSSLGAMIDGVGVWPMREHGGTRWTDA